MTANTDVFDLARIEAQWGAPVDDIYRVVLSIFATEGGERCAEARVSLAEGRRDALHRAAHTLAGASANVGAIHLSNCAASLEAAAKTQPEKTLGELLNQVESAWQAVRNEIRAGGPRTRDS
jgi:HPt (histidine-containing phosphotransfer) domain-containing protein